MLMTHPAVLKDLVEQYETLRALHAEKGSPSVRQRREGVAYTRLHAVCLHRYP